MTHAIPSAAKQRHRLFIKLQLLALALLLPVFTYAGNIKGFVLDNTGESVIGAVIKVENTSLGSVAGLDGSYEIKNVPAGTYTVSVSYVSYTKTSIKVTVAGNETVTASFKLQPQANELKETVVNATASGTSDAGARLREKNADNILNMLSARTIQLAPDVTVANVLRRVSGVTVDRGDDGEGRYAVIRGMDKRYNYTLVNGIKIPSPDDKNRYVPMDMFPSELLQRLEVIKALTPDMEGDAIGGAMNLVMKDAPDHLLIQAQAAAGYSQQLFNGPFESYNHSAVQMQSPAEAHGNPNYLAAPGDFSKSLLDIKKSSPLPDGQFGLTIGDRFLNHKLGVLFSGMYQSTDRTSKEDFFVPNPQPDAFLNDQHPDLADLQVRNYYTHSDRLGLNLRLDYDINSKNKISFYTMLMKLNTYQIRDDVDSSASDRAINGVWIPGTGQVNEDYRVRTTLQTIYNATLQGQHNINDHFFIDWSAVYSLATQQVPDWADLNVSHTLSKDSTGNINVPPFTPSSLTYIWQHNRDQDLSGYLNLHYKRQIGSQKIDIGVGGMYRHKDRSNYYNQYDLEPDDPQAAFTNIYNTGFNFNLTNAAGTPINDNVYTITEDVAAAYFEVRWQPTPRWNILAGVREEATSDQYNQTTEPITADAKEGTITYADVLPGLHAKYKLTDKSSLHASYFKSISRPNFFEIVPYNFPGEYFTEVGNPFLKHTTADNVDLRYEFFPGKSDQLLIGAFYKNIQNPIEYVYIRNKLSEADLQPQNLGTATNIGAEVVYTKYFNKFGVSLNYTYTYSNIPTSKRYYTDTAETATATTQYITQNRPLQGQAANIGNISVLYKDAKNGIDLQIAGIYTGRRIVYVSPYYDLDYWAKGAFILDFSAEKTLGKHFAVFAKLNNLLNTPDVIELLHSTAYLNGEWPIQTNANRILVEKKYYGQNYLVGVRYHL